MLVTKTTTCCWDKMNPNTTFEGTGFVFVTAACKLLLHICRSFQGTTETAESGTCISISPSSPVNLSGRTPPPPTQTQPRFLLSAVPNLFWKRPSLAVPLWNYPYLSSTPFSQASSSGPHSLYRLFFSSGICLPSLTNQQRIDAYCA